VNQENLEHLRPHAVEKNSSAGKQLREPVFQTIFGAAGEWHIAGTGAHPKTPPTG
jgi:hypothetical protein